jgi:hypothetical protein
MFFFTRVKSKYLFFKEKKSKILNLCVIVQVRKFRRLGEHPLVCRGFGRPQWNIRQQAEN